MIIASDRLAQLRILQRQYLQLVDPSQLRWPDAQVLKSPEVQHWMFLHMFDESSVKSPPPERYQLRVIKLLIAKLERSVVDPEEDVRFPISSISFQYVCDLLHPLHASILSVQILYFNCSRIRRFCFTFSC